MNDIKVIAIDVDGTLTDGSIIYGSGGIELKTFNVRDGLAVKALSTVGIKAVIITGRGSEVVARRAAELKCGLFQNVEDKVACLENILRENNCSFENAAFIGDDIPDYAAMLMCAVRCCPSDAAAEIRSVANYISPFAGGKGAVRDIIEHILRRCGKWNGILKAWRVDNEL